MVSLQKRKLTRKFAILALALIAIAASLWGLRIMRTARALQALASELLTIASSEPADMDLERAAELVGQARDQAGTLARLVRPITPLTDRMGAIPRFGPTIAAAGPLTHYAAALTEAADELIGWGLPVLEALEGGANPDDRIAGLLGAASSGQAHLDAASLAFEQAAAAESQFQLDMLIEPLRTPLEPIIGKSELGGQAVQALGSIPWLLGADGPRSYVLMAQNEDELRATGGFISAIGTVELADGVIQALEIDDSYAVDNFEVDYPDPPEPLQRFMLADIWLVRDANWSPDFPTSADQVRRLYTLSTGERTDGLIALNQIVVEQLLQATGPLTLPQIELAVSSNNVRDYMRRAWEPDPGEGPTEEWWAQRKDFIGLLGSALIERVLHLETRDGYLEVGRTLFRLLEQKQLLVQFDDPAISALLDELGLSGRVTGGPGDLLMLVDSNIGFNKVDARVTRRLEYSVDLSDPEAPSASVEITYTHQASSAVPCEHRPTYGEGTYAGLMQRCYWDYVRIYTPAGTRLIEGELPSVPAENLLNKQNTPGGWEASDTLHDTRPYAGLFLLPTGSQMTIGLQYSLPGRVLESDDGSLHYRLRVLKQPGTHGVPITISIQPPEGFETPTESDFERAADGSLNWQGRLHTDLDFELVLQPQAN